MTTASIVTYNTSRRDLEKVLTSALSSSIERIYIIDHSPQDGLENEIKSITGCDRRVTYRRYPNTGYGAGHNRAIRMAMEAGARYHAVLNPDIYWTDPVIETLAGYMDKHPEVGQMLPKVLYPDGRLQYTCKLIPTPLDLIASRFLPSYMTKKRMQRFRLEKSGYNNILNVPYMHGCFMMLRLDTLRITGLFDERFFMYPEDIDLTRRIHEQALTLFFPFVTIYHAHAAASAKWGKMLWIHITNMIRYFNKWGWFFDRKRRFYNRRVIASIADTVS